MIGDFDMEKFNMMCWKVLVMLFKAFYFLVLAAAIYTVADIILHCSEWELFPLFFFY